jgi:hypothetical protein
LSYDPLLTADIKAFIIKARATTANSLCMRTLAALPFSRTVGMKAKKRRQWSGVGMDGI